ncbi:hypothetical protein LINPERHAP1_LOCUS17837 [Linum perenne]
MRPLLLRALLLRFLFVWAFLVRFFLVLLLLSTRTFGSGLSVDRWPPGLGVQQGGKDGTLCTVKGKQVKHQHNNKHEKYRRTTIDASPSGVVRSPPPSSQCFRAFRPRFFRL